MRIINRYIMKNLLLTLSMALVVLVFVMMGAYVVRMFDMLSRGVSCGIFLKLLLYMLPDVLRYALPFSVMIATVLVFSHMSADNEIVALKASGISIWQVVAPGMVLCAGICVFCLYLGLYLAPVAWNESIRIKEQALAGENLAALIAPGEITRLSDKLSIRVGRIEGNVMYDVHCYVFGKNDGEGNSVPLDDITAESGMFVTDAEQGVRKLVLNHFSGTQLPRLSDESEDGDNGPSVEHPFLSADTLEIPFGYGENTGKQTVKLPRKTKMMEVRMLLGNMLMIEDRDPKRACSHMVDLQSRLALAFAPFALFVLSVPFGIHSRRNETSAGLLVCVALGIVFYVFMMLGRTFDKNPAIFPQYIVWIPNLVYQIVGLIAIRKIDKR